MSGKGPGGGFDYQARVNAYVSVHILAGQALRWTQAALGDVPVAITAESGGSGDDLRVELGDVNLFYESQAKRRLSADARLDDTIDKFSLGLPQHPQERGIIIVDPGSARTIVPELRDALEARRQGKKPKEEGAYKRVLERLRAPRAEHAVDRLHVLALDVENDASSHTLVAIDRLAPVLDDPDQTGAAWNVLVADGLRMCREGGRRTREHLVRILGQENIAVRGDPRGSSAQLKVVREQQIQTLGGVQEILALLKVEVEAAAETPDAFTIRLDSAKDMLQRGNPDAALALLRAMTTEVAAAVPATRVRYHNLSGLALMHLGKHAAASDELEAALRIDSLNTGALANLAQLAMMEGRPQAAEDYADRALVIDPTALNAWIVLAQCRADAAVPEELAKEPHLLAARASRLLRVDQYPEAILMLREANRVGGFDAERAIMLAHALALGPLTGASVGDDRVDLDEAVGLLNAALAADPDRHYRDRAVRALIMRGQIDLFRGRTDGVDSYIEAARVDPSSEAATCLIAQLWLERREPEKALRAIEAMPVGARNGAVQAMLARALLTLGRADEAKVVFDEAVRLTAAPDRELSTVLIELAINASWLDIAQRLLETIFLKPEWIERLFRARIASRRGQTDEADAYFREAIDARIDVPEDVSQLRGEYAEFLRQRGLADRAVGQLELAGAPLRKELRQSYARALYDARKLSKAGALVELVKAEGGELPDWALGLGAHVASCADDVPAMVEFLSQELAREPDDIEVALRLAHAHLRLRQSATAVGVLDTVRERGKAAPRQMLHLAELYIRAGAPEHALPLAYTAWRAEPLSEDVQLAFIGLTNQLEHREATDPESVAPDTRVKLKGDDGSDQTYFVVGEGAPGAIVGEIGSSSALAVAMIGKRLGDRVTLHPGELSQLDTTIVEIKNRYVHAFQDITTHFPQRHPDSAALQAFHIPDNPKIEDLTFMTEAVRRGAESDQKVSAMYAQHQLPLGFVAKLLRRSLVDAYSFVASNRAAPFLVEFGDAFERSRDAAASTSPAVITRTALVTAVYLDILNIVPRVHPNLVAPRSLLDELNEERAQLERPAREGYMGAVYRDGGLRLETAPADHFTRQIARLDVTIAWVERHCTIHGRPLALIEQKDQEQERDMYGASSHDSLLLADALAGELYADDFGLRRAVLETTRRIGFSTFTLLAAARRSGDVSVLQYDRYIGALLRLNHCPIPMSASALRTAFEDDGFRLSPKVMLLVDVLRNSQENLGTLVVYAVDVLLGLAVSTTGRSHLAVVTRTLAEAISERRDSQTVVDAMKYAVSLRMQLLPAEHDTVRAALERYGQFVRSGSSVLL